MCPSCSSSQKRRPNAVVLQMMIRYLLAIPYCFIRFFSTRLEPTHNHPHHLSSFLCLFASLPPSFTSFLSAPFVSELSSANPKFLNSSFAIKFLQHAPMISPQYLRPSSKSQFPTQTCMKASDLPIHPTRQIWFRQISTFWIIHASNFLHATEITLHHWFAFAYNRTVVLVYRSAIPYSKIISVCALVNSYSREKSEPYHHDPMENFLFLACIPNPIVSFLCARIHHALENQENNIRRRFVIDHTPTRASKCTHNYLMCIYR